MSGQEKGIWKYGGCEYSELQAAERADHFWSSAAGQAQLLRQWKKEGNGHLKRTAAKIKSVVSVEEDEISPDVNSDNVDM